MVSYTGVTHGYSTPPIPTQAYYLLTVALVHERHAYGYYGCTYYGAYYGTYNGTLSVWAFRWSDPRLYTEI